MGADGDLLARLRADLRRRMEERAVAAAFLKGRYELGDRIGEGAAAVVHRGFDRELRRPVAVKILRTLEARGPLRERFLREAQALARLDHPDVVRVFDVGEEDGRLFLVLELVEGTSLEAALSARDTAWGLRTLVRVARAVHHVHERGVVHRDLKPENVLVTTDGSPKVADFGVARLSEGAALTRTGGVVGTPLYMAPEQVLGSGDDVGPASDVYALGAMLYRIASGRPPHEAEGMPELYEKIAREDAPPLRARLPSVPRDLEAVAARALERVPRRRYPTAQAFANDLERHLQGETVQAPLLSRGYLLRRAMFRRRGVLAATAGAVLLLAVFAGLRLEDSRDVRARTRALSLLESARGPLERMTAGQRVPGASYEAYQTALAAARAQAEEAVRLSPDLPVAHHRLAEILELRGLFEDAERAWRRAVDLDPGFGAAFYRLGRVLLWRAYLATTPLWDDPAGERRAQAESIARDAALVLSRAQEAEAGIDSVLQQRLAEAMRLYLGGKPSEARKAVEAGLRDAGGREGAEDFHWLCSLLESSFDDRIAAVDRALALRPGHPLALYVRADALMRSGHPDRAIPDYDRALAISPDFAEALLYRGSCRLQTRRAQEASEDFDALIRRGAHLAAAYNGRGHVRLDLLGDLEGALADLDAAIRLRPDDYALPYIARGKARLRRQEYAAAAEDFGRALLIVPSNQVRSYRMTARLLAGDRTGALDDLARLHPTGATRQALERELDRRLEEYLRTGSF